MFAFDQAGNAEGEKDAVFAQEIEGGLSQAIAEIKGCRRRKAKRGYGN